MSLFKCVLIMKDAKQKQFTMFLHLLFAIHALWALKEERTAHLKWPCSSAQLDHIVSAPHGPARVINQSLSCCFVGLIVSSQENLLFHDTVTDDQKICYKVSKTRCQISKVHQTAQLVNRGLYSPCNPSLLSLIPHPHVFCYPVKEQTRPLL